MEQIFQLEEIHIQYSSEDLLILPVINYFCLKQGLKIQNNNYSFYLIYHQSNGYSFHKL